MNIHPLSQVRSLRTKGALGFLIIWALLIQGCATYAPQTNLSETTGSHDVGKPSHTIFFAGGYGNSQSPDAAGLLDDLEAQLKDAGKDGTLIFLGDNVRGEKGEWESDSLLLNRLLKIARGFEGQSIFLPGGNEWEQNSADQLQKIGEFIESAGIEKVQQLPENGCPLQYIPINDQLDIILVDSRWFTSNWASVEGINSQCTEINTRRRFAEELEGYINDGQNKNILIAMHHPVFSNGRYAGKETLKSHLLPVPVLGSLLQVIGELGAFSPEYLNARRYEYLRILVSTLAKDSDRIVIASGHEESLQYLEGGGIKQVIAGSLGGKTATHLSEGQISTVGGTLKYEGRFSYGAQGFGRIDYYADGHSVLRFFDSEGKTRRFPLQQKMPEEIPLDTLPTPPPAGLQQAAIEEDPDFLNRSGFYRFLWGERYRKYFGTPVKAPVVMLDTLYGGLEVVKEGGGHQSYSIRLEDEKGKQYSMRSLRKSALKFLKFKVKGIAYTADAYEDTWADEVVSDFFTTAHPYMQLVISPMARAAGINHSSPELFYVPRQERLGNLNQEFGDELYFIEERPSDEQKDYKGYRRTLDSDGNVKDFESTTDMLERIREDESFIVDQRDFIRARIFDMVIGDWDRHQDQWRWVEYEKEDGDRIFQPVPRDRDNAFPKFDGTMMPVLKLFIPDVRRWQSYGDTIRNIKWFNTGGNKLDRALLTRYDARVWEEEAREIQRALTPEVIQKAFDRLPLEVQDSTANRIRENVMARLQSLPEYARAYSRQLDKIVALHGTEKDDRFEITRLEEGQTRVVIRRILSDEPDKLMYDRTFSGEHTRELWIYGLGDDDTFEVEGESETPIFIRLIGGYGEDHYAVSQPKHLKVYDWKHEKLHFDEVEPRHQLTNIYQTNTYHWRYFDQSSNILAPGLGFRTDDGVFLGLKDTYSKFGFNGDPYRQQHRLKANYFFNFKALELTYAGVFANIFPKWNFEVDGYFTTDRYSRNYFGAGNESTNQEDTFGRDYHRARLQISQLSAGLAFRTLRIKALYESFETRELTDRYFIPENLGEEVFRKQHYLGGELSLFYYNDDAKDFPTKSLSFGLATAYKWNPSLAGNHFGYIRFHTGFSHQLLASGDVVLSSRAEVMSNFGQDYFFYHAPSLGGNNGLRGFRDERFAGKTYFYQTSDLRFRLKNLVTPVVPVTMGTYLGFDYGRVWLPDENSKDWHYSYGGGVWLSGVNYWTFNAGFFHSVEGNIIQAGLGFEF